MRIATSCFISMRVFSIYAVTEESATIASTGEEVPLTKTRCHQVLLGGNQLTVARARSAIRSVGNSDSSSQKLSGVIPVVEDWHAKLTYGSIITLINLVENMIRYIIFTIC